MTRVSDKVRLPVRSFVNVLLFIGWVALRVSPLAAHDHAGQSNPTKPIPLTGQWEYLKAPPAKGLQTAFPEKTPGNDQPWRSQGKITVQEQEVGRDFWFRRILPEVPWPEAYYLAQTDAPAFAVYLDSTRIYSYGDVSRAASGRPEGLSFHTIPLPPGSSGRVLTLWLPNTRAYEFDNLHSLIAPGPALPKAIRSMLVWPMVSDLIGLILGGMFSIIGLAVIAFYLLRGLWRNLAMLSFGIYALLCGLMFLPNSYLVQFLFPTPNVVWWQVNAVLGYLIGIPIFLFIIQLVGKGWRSTLLWAFWFFIAFSAIGLASDFLLQVPTSLLRGNPWTTSLITFAFLLVVLANLYRPSQNRSLDLGILRAGFTMFAAAIIANYLSILKIIPLQFDPSPLGNFLFVCCVGYLAARQYSENEKQLAVLEQEMKTARKIQSSILPQAAPKVRGFDIVMRYLPMAQVAGDFYDFLVVDDRRLGVLVADVSGHGVPAALIASMVKVAFASESSHASDPARVLTEMNKALGGNPNNQFITAACLFLDAEKREMVYSAAGHPPMYLWRRAEANVLEFQENGLILGPFPEAAYTNLKIALEPGDRFILYTDGIPEAKNTKGEYFGEERFKTFITAHPDLPPAGFADSFLGHLTSWTGKASAKALDDDVTLIVVDIKESER